MSRLPAPGFSSKLKVPGFTKPQSVDAACEGKKKMIVVYFLWPFVFWSLNNIVYIIGLFLYLFFFLISDTILSSYN